jgi:alkanesulfonate monooxygenase SsuD/methylene tetrahydromethanopterin reductase-like flavin-dependent oxidoreductase (luciferase family)
MTSFGIMTAPQHVEYADLERVWREADQVELVEHAWLFDHLLPLGDDRRGPILEGWTALTALLARTERLRGGLLVTSNRFRPPALLARMATTVDIASGGRLDFGIGAGSRPSVPWAREEYAAHGLPYHSFTHSVAALDEALTVIRGIWTAEAPFDFTGEHVQVEQAWGNPKPAKSPPVVIGGRSDALLRVVARHADVWNIPGGDLADAVERSAYLDARCAELGRDPGEITRSMHVAPSVEVIRRAQDAGFTHFVLPLSPPYADGVVERLADEVLAKV